MLQLFKITTLLIDFLLFGLESIHLADFMFQLKLLHRRLHFFRHNSSVDLRTVSFLVPQSEWPAGRPLSDFVFLLKLLVRFGFYPKVVNTKLDAIFQLFIFLLRLAEVAQEFTDLLEVFCRIVVVVDAIGFLL